MEKRSHENDYLTLAEAAKVAPGRPALNCIWRWCREGVKSRSGEQIRLRHIRVGSRIYTTRDWIEAFGADLAASDARHFNRDSDPQPARPSRRSRLRPDTSTGAMKSRHDSAQQELEAAGL